jgi:HD superfamily phosphohydrolase
VSERERILRHLDEDYTRPYRDPIWRHIYLSEPLLAVTNSLPFQKLAGIRQLGPTYLVYPGATHTRFSHSLGVFNLSKRMITQLVKKDRGGTHTLGGVKAFLCAALLHDLGHYPFAHSLKDLAVKPHEQLTGEAVLGKKEITRIIEQELRVPAAWVAAIVDQGLPWRGPIAVPVYRNLLSGVLDPDKLDYLNRDAYFCGVPYGVQDIDFIFDQIHPHPEKGLAISSRGLGSVESVLFAKYLMYRNVYWHRTVRVVTAMIKKAIMMGLASGVIGVTSLYGIDDGEFLSLMASVSYPPFELAQQAFSRQLYRAVARVPFSPSSALHARLETSERRLEYEAELASAAGRVLGRTVTPEEVIIDVPERQSFEIDLAVREEDEWIPYERSASIFGGAVVEGFTGALRQVSLLCPDRDDLASALASLDALAPGREGAEAQP